MNVLRSTSTINKADIFFEIIGEGHPLILLHSELTDSRIFDFQVKEFAANQFQVIRYDIRGYGKSEQPLEPFFYYEDLSDLMSFLKIEKAFLLGVSLGAEIAIDFTLKFPNRVNGLLLISPSIGGYKRSSKSALDDYNIWHSIINKDEKYEESIDYLLNNQTWRLENNFIRSYLKDILMEGYYKWLLDDYVKIVEPAAVDRISEIKTPTLIIVGENDSKNCIEAAKILEANIDNSRTEIIKKTGKLLNLDKPSQFNQMVLDFLLKIENL